MGLVQLDLQYNQDLVVCNGCGAQFLLWGQNLISTGLTNIN